MTGYQSKKAMAQAIDKVNWADHEPDGRRAAAQDKLDSMEREALKLALEALEAAEIDGNCEYGATEIIRKALAQPEQEPVACKHEWFRTGAMEPRECRCIKCGAWNTTPPQRTWVGLTDEDIALIDWESLITKKDCVRAIEAKLKERNA